MTIDTKALADKLMDYACDLIQLHLMTAKEAAPKVHAVRKAMIAALDEALAEQASCASEVAYEYFGHTASIGCPKCDSKFVLETTKIGCHKCGAEWALPKRQGATTFHVPRSDQPSDVAGKNEDQ